MEEEDDIFEDAWFGEDEPDIGQIFQNLKSNNLHWEHLAEPVFTSITWLIGSASNGYVLMRTLRRLNKKYPQIPALSLIESIAISRLFTSFALCASQLNNLMPLKTAKQFISELKEAWSI